MFNLIAEKWWEVPATSTIAVSEGTTKVRRKEDDADLERDLFPPTYTGELNGLELEVACFIDRQEAISWWYKNLVRGNAYGLHGWRRNRIYPDFIIAQERRGELERWLLIETKGDQLAFNLDTTYKRDLMGKLTGTYAKPPSKVGQLTLLESRAKYNCAMVAESTWEQDLRLLLGSSSDEQLE